MKRHETDEFCEAEKARGKEPMANCPGDLPQQQIESPAPVLARIPDANIEKPQHPPGRESSARSDGRLVSQSLSTKLLLGGCLLLVAAAVVPFMLSGSQQQGGKPPAPDAKPAPLYDGKVAQAPAAARNVQQAPAELSFQAEIPAGPGFTATAPAAPAQVQLNRKMKLGSTPGSTPGKAAGSAPGSAAGNSRQARPHDAAEPRTAWRQPAGNDYSPQPGVARLEGIILKPSVRTTYDRSGSSIH